jgi:hypothetical protein
MTAIPPYTEFIKDYVISYFLKETYPTTDYIVIIQVTMDSIVNDIYNGPLYNRGLNLQAHLKLNEYLSNKKKFEQDYLLCMSRRTCACEQ